MTMNGCSRSRVMSRPWTAPSSAPSATIASTRRGPGEVPLGQHHRQQHAEQRERRSDRQVDAAGDDDQAEAEAEDPERADQPRRVLQVGRRQEPRVERGDDRAQHHQQQECRELFLHARMLFDATPTRARRWCRCRVPAGPAEHVARASGRSDELRRVAGSARRLDRRHAACRRRELTVSTTSLTEWPRPVPRLIAWLGVPRAEALERAQVRVGQIHDVDVVADRRAVRRRVVGAEHLHRRARARAAPMTSGIRCVSGSWSSPISPSGSAPAALK